ncbi:unnamed protein product [Amoebophrya sp. A25]|nr:unnamed protein product [Amoebophrya sp. A25]|eukprot:GSA25T00012085001.1
MLPRYTIVGAKVIRILKRTVLSRICNRFDLHLSSVVRVTNNLDESVAVRSSLSELHQVLHIPAKSQAWVSLPWLFPRDFYQRYEYRSEDATVEALLA